MEIIWHGHSFFEIIGRPLRRSFSSFGESGEQKKITILINPFDEKIGLKPKKATGDILLVSHNNNNHLNKKNIEGNPFLIEEPGEYEVQDVKIKAIPLSYDEKTWKERRQNIIFLFNIEDIKICHMGDLGEAELSNMELEEIIGVDIFLVPVGGKFTISGKEAAKIVTQVEPQIVIPMHYKIPGIKIDIDDEKPFLKGMGIKEKEVLKKLKIKKRDLREEKDGTEVVILEKV